MKLTTNEAPIDRAIRVVLGLALAGIAVVGSIAAPLVYLVWLVAALALVTGVIGFCPAYAAVGVRTNKSSR